MQNKPQNGKSFADQTFNFTINTYVDRLNHWQHLFRHWSISKIVIDFGLNISDYFNLKAEKNKHCSGDIKIKIFILDSERLTQTIWRDTFSNNFKSSNPLPVPADIVLYRLWNLYNLYFTTTTLVSHVWETGFDL